MSLPTYTIQLINTDEKKNNPGICFLSALTKWHQQSSFHDCDLIKTVIKKTFVSSDDKSIQIRNLSYKAIHNKGAPSVRKYSKNNIEFTYVV